MAQASPKRTTPLRREEIVDAARTMLADTDLESLSLRRLASSLGVTAPALYAHVEHKGDLLTAVAEQGFRELVDAFDAVEADDPIERMKQYGHAYVEQAISDPGLFRVMFVFRPDPIPVPGADNELAAATTAFAKPALAIAEAMESGDIHPDRDPLLTAMTLWTTTHGLATVLLLGNSGGEVILFENSRELIDDVINVTLCGLKVAPD
ncbi:MAG: TetR/AcrR family transcriptional regulator [Microthrixaceae bacterium]